MDDASHGVGSQSNSHGCYNVAVSVEGMSPSDAEALFGGVKHFCGPRLKFCDTD